MCMCMAGPFEKWGSSLWHLIAVQSPGSDVRKERAYVDSDGVQFMYHRERNPSLNLDEHFREFMYKVNIHYFFSPLE